MESTRLKAEVMKPVLLKAGIPLALSVAGFIYAKIAARRSSVPKASSVEIHVNSLKTDSHEEFNDEESFHSLNSMSLPCIENEDHNITDTHFTSSLEIRDIRDLEEEILSLRRRIEDFQEKEWKLEMRFLRYCDMKEQESVLLELQNMLLLEIARVEFLGSEISSMEVDNQRLEDLVIEYLRVLEQLEFSKLENGLLQRKVNKLSSKKKERSHVIREQNSIIKAREAEISRYHDELERRTDVITELGDENKELRTMMDRLQEENNELSNNLEVAEKSASSRSQIEAERITMEDYNQLVNEQEQLQKDRADEVKELIYLRWSNACLRHQLMRKQEQEEQNQEKKNHLELDFEGRRENGDYGLEHEYDSSILEHSETCLDVMTCSHVHSKRPKLLQKLRRWVEGGEKIKQKLDEKEKHEIKCFGRHSVSDGAEEQHLHARKSCSSA